MNTNNNPEIVELLGKSQEVIIPYNEVEITGGVTGSGHTRSDGKIKIEANLSGAITLEGFVDGESRIDDTGNYVIKTHKGKWETYLTNNGYTLNFCRDHSEDN